jgi:CheY-like chemotaxis protein
MRVLIVDDSPDSAGSMALLLRLIGLKVDTARNGVEALEIARRDRPDVGLIDMSMPTVDGRELARQLHRLYPERPFLIAITAEHGADAGRQTADADLHLVKPADPFQIFDLLRGRLESPPSPQNRPA